MGLALALTACIASAQTAQPPELKADWAFATDAAHPGGVVHAALKVSIGGGFHLQSNKPLDEFLIPTSLTVEPPQGLTVREIVYPPSVEFNVAGEKALVFDSNFVIGVALTVDETLAPGKHQIKGTFRYQACNDKVCLSPTTVEIPAELNVVAADRALVQTHQDVFAAIRFSESPAPIDASTTETPRNSTDLPTGSGSEPDCDVLAELDKFELLGATGGFMNADDFIAFVDGAETGTLKRSLLEGKGPLAIIALVIIGGVLLNLTPCVLPLIPINLAIIGAGAQAGSRARGFALGGAYGLAMAVVYGALGLIVTLTSTAFGTINSTIWFNVAIAALFVVLALAMFDVISIDFTKYQSNIDATKIGKRGSLSLAFFMGCVTALLAGACVAPVVIQVVVYAGDQYAKGSAIALALPFFLGLGMALPWPFAGAGLSLLPKPGKWMNWVKKGMGVFILAFAAYYAYLAYGIWDSTRVDAAAVQTAVKEQLEGGWTPDICAGLAQARAENKLVLIDMWATWCKNCLAMDKSTLKDDRVLARLDDYVKIKFQAEDLTAPPSAEMLERFEQIGLPAYAILRPRGADASQARGASN